LLTGSGWLPEPLRTPGQLFGQVLHAEAPVSFSANADQSEAEMAADVEAWPAAAE